VQGLSFLLVLAITVETRSGLRQVWLVEVLRFKPLLSVTRCIPKARKHCAPQVDTSLLHNRSEMIHSSTRM
jgi:hypothetical protein